MLVKHIVRELRQILFVNTLVFVVPVLIAIDPYSIYQNVPLNILFNITTHLCIQILGYATYKLEMCQNMSKMYMSGVTFSPYLPNMCKYFSKEFLTYIRFLYMSEIEMLYSL